MTDFTKCTPEELARVTTRDGRKVVIVTRVARGNKPILGYVDMETDLKFWRADGVWESGAYAATRYDLILPPAERVVYVRAYTNWEQVQEGARITFDPVSGRTDWTDYRLTLGPNPKIERVE